VAARSKSLTNSLVELLVIVLIALGLAFGIQAFVVKPYKIPSGSMEPTLIPGQRVLVDRIGHDFGNPSVGEIVVFHPPVEAEHEVCGPDPHRVVYGQAPCSAPVTKEDTSINYIKRVVAGPGDEIEVKEGDAYVCAARAGRSKCAPSEFIREKAPYLKDTCVGQAASPECSFPTPIKVPAGHWFMMGDNRGESDDSRFWGPIPTSWIVGDAFFTYWPPDRIGTL
jgi:signal peptidase I